MNGIEIKRLKEKKPCRAFVFTGGKAFCAEKMTDIPTENDIVIAADSGCKTLMDFSDKVKKITPDLILGDMDSFPKEKLSEFEGIPFLPFPPEKDDTDTGLAVDIALSFGCGEIIIIGGLGGRLDHTLANVFLLEHIKENGSRGIITDGKNRAYLANRENIFFESTRKYLSLVPLDNEITEVLMDEGFKYPYKADKVTRCRFVTVSNEIKKFPARLCVKSGTALIIESGD